MDLIFLVVVWIWTLIDNEPCGACRSPQYLYLGDRGTVYCSFTGHFRTIVWYPSTAHKAERPILYLSNSGKTGSGYDSGEFDAYDNGSLIIENVSMKHDHTFRMFVDISDERVIGPYDIVVIVAVKPEQTFPLIGNCKEHERVCYLGVDQISLIYCIVQNARPAVNLTWWTRDIKKDHYQSVEHFVLTDEAWKSTNVSTLYVPHSSKAMVLLVCKASEPPSLLLNSESMILLEYMNTTNVAKAFQTRFCRICSEVTLNCKDQMITSVVWKKLFPGGTHELIAYAVFGADGVTRIYKDDVELDSTGSLVLKNIQVIREGVYACTYANGSSSGVQQYELSVFVPPNPTYLIVEGCSTQQYCVLDGSENGSLSCSVKGIRPLINLQWRTSQPSTSNLVSFIDQKVEVKEHGDAFDITLTTKYEFKPDLVMDKVTIECRTSGEHADLFNLTTKLDLALAWKHIGLYTTSEHNSADQWKLVLTLTLLILAVCVVVVLYIVIKIVRRRIVRTNWREDDENTQASLPQMPEQREGNDEETGDPMISGDTNT